MKRILTVLTLILWSAAGLFAVTLEEAFKAAVDKTEFGSIQEAQKKQVEGRREKAASALFPQLALKGGYSLQQSSAASGYSDSTTLALNLSQIIYEGGQLSLSLKEAELQEKSKQLQLLSARLSLYALVADGFYSVIAAEKDRENIESIIKQTKEVIVELEKRRVIGKAKYSEVLMAQAQLASLESDQVGVQRTINTSREDFAFLTGLPRDSKLETTEKIEIFPGEIDLYLKAVATRPDILALQADLETAKAETALQASFGFPWLTLSGNYYPYRTGSSSGINWDGGLVLNFSLFDWGSTGGRVKEAGNKEKESSLNLDKKIRQADSDVRSAYDRLKSLLLQIEKLEAAVELSQKNYIEQTKDYNFSLVTNLEVLQAMNTMQNAKRSLDRTKQDTLASWIELLTTSGISPLVKISKE